jgi:hypothetical protein
MDTYINSNQRMTDFIEILDHNSGSFKALKITGSGNSHHKTFWLNVRDVTNMKITKGLVNVAINDWRDYASVRYV